MTVLLRTSLLFYMRTFALAAFIYALAWHGSEVQGASPPENSNPPDKRVATIVMVDPAKRTLTLRAKGANYLFFLNSHVMNTRTHEAVALDELAAGQLISFISRPRADGQLEIVSLMVLPNGPGSGPVGGSRGGPLEVSPFR